MAINAGMMSSATDQWGTPSDLFKELDTEFNFTLDACASPWNYKVDNYYSEEDNGLEQPWTGVVWCNPPYGRAIRNWIQKGYESSVTGATVVMLIPARTDTTYWHDYVMRGDIRFLKGRIKFVQPDGTAKDPAPFPSAVVIFKPKEN